MLQTYIIASRNIKKNHVIEVKRIMDTMNFWLLFLTDNIFFPLAQNLLLKLH